MCNGRHIISTTRPHGIAFGAGAIRLISFRLKTLGEPRGAGDGGLKPQVPISRCNSSIDSAEA